MSFDRDTIIQWLKEGPSVITFIKKDGSQRVMSCTLQESKLPAPTERKRQKKENADIIAVWSIDDNGWRSVRLESICSIRPGDSDVSKDS